MIKGIELTESQIKAYENGATMFLFPIQVSDFWKELGNAIDDIEKVTIHPNGITYSIYSKTDDSQTNEVPIKKGDKNIFIREKKIICEHCKRKQNWIELEEIISIQECPYCGYCNEIVADTLKECIDIKVTRIKNIAIKDWGKILNKKWDQGVKVDLFYKTIVPFYEEQLKEQNINRTHKDNDYVFLVEFKR